MYRYDLTQGMARSMGPMLIGRPLEGIWHTSIVVFGKEYYFDGGIGITADPNPGRTRFGQPYRTEVLGQTRKRHEDFFVWTQQQRSAGFGPNDYHLLNNNCNSFSDAACMFLLGRHIPQDVLEMIPTLLSTPMGQMLRPMLEQATSAGGMGGMGGSPSFVQASPLPPPPAPAAPRGESCVGLLSRHTEVTEADEEELMLAQAMLESNETIADGPRSPPDAFEKAISGLTLLQTIMANICAHPTEAKYRALSMESNAYKTKLKPLEPYGVTEVLRIAGFVRRPHSSGAGGEQWYLSDAAGSAALLERVGEMLALTISSIEGAAADAAKARATGAGAVAVTPPSTPSSTTTCTAEGDASVAKTLSSPPSPTAATASAVLQYCYPPFPKDWTPLSVGCEGGAPLFSIHCLPTSGAGPSCFGKCRLSPNQQHLQAYYCSNDGREVEVPGGYEVLCVRRGQESSVAWVPANMAVAAAAATKSSASFLFTGYGRFGVVRAEHGCGVHPGVLEPSGRCVIPYGGKAVVVTAKAEVLCERARLPDSLARVLQAVQKGSDLAQLLREANGQPIGSFDALLRTWQPPAFYVPPHPLQRRTRLHASGVDWSEGEDTTVPGASASSRLLVCHDFRGGYTAGERPTFVLEPLEGVREKRRTRTEARRGSGGGDAASLPQRVALVEGTYTVSYWDRVDYFVYFSHQRISVPPRGWVHEGHRRGVAVLGTIITEGGAGDDDLELLLSDAKRMARIIERLVQVCDVYGFDGYLLNIENELPPQLAKRLVVFCTQLRKQLNLKPSLRSARYVIWYDAITIDDELHYQNALTKKNKPFFDVSDGIFTNYFWNPVHIAMSQAAAGPRGGDVFVGVDVFGRGVFGGGEYNTYVAVNEAVRADLSVALFAPGWTMECESDGSRDGFAEAESQLWAPMQGKLRYRTRFLPSGAFYKATVSSEKPSCANQEEVLRAWTTFQSNVGYDFYVNGSCVTARVVDGGVAAWCEPAAAHALPPFQYEASTESTHSNPEQPVRGSRTAKRCSPFAAVAVRLPASALKVSMYGSTIRAEWRFDKAWFGDRCLGCVLPPLEAAELLRWNVRNALPAMSGNGENTASASVLHVEVVLDDAEVAAVPVEKKGGSGGASSPARSTYGLRLGLFSASRGAFFANLWDNSAQMEQVTGPKSVVVVDASSTCVGDAVGGQWRREHYVLQNFTTEAVHLVSVSLANGDAGRTVRVCVGGVAMYHTAAATQGEGPLTRSTGSLLTADGPCVWATHVTHPTGKSDEQVLELTDADRVFAEVRAVHGVRSTVVVFAAVATTTATSSSASPVDDSGVDAAAGASVGTGDGYMYLGQYSVDPADGTTYKDAVLISVSLPGNRKVTKVIYYTIFNGY